jgi:hypothetical protein
VPLFSLTSSPVRVRLQRDATIAAMIVGHERPAEVSKSADVEEVELRGAGHGLELPQNL